MKKKWKWIAGVVLALVIIVTATAQGIRPLKLELLEIKKGSIAKTFTEEGLVVTDSEYPVSSVSGGKVVRLPVEEGQTVKKGDVLIEFDSTELVFQAEQLRAQLKSTAGEEAKVLKDTYATDVARQEAVLEQAKRNRDAAKNTYDRINTLYQAGAVSEAEYETARDALADAENTVTIENAALEALKAHHKPGAGAGQYYAGLKESLQAQLTQVEYQIDQCSIKAPAEGTIAKLSVKEGDTVAPNSPVMTLLEKGLFEVEVFVLTEDVDELKTGDKVTLIQDKLYSDVSFPGTVTGIAPAAVEKTSTLGLLEQRVKVTVLPEVPDNITLRPGYALDVQFKTAEEHDRLVVPKTALFPFQNGEAVWAVRNGKAQIQPIEKGFENKTEVSVTKGLREGDFVILDLQAKGLKEGKRVKQQG